MKITTEFQGTKITVVLESNVAQTAIAQIGDTAVTHGTWKRVGGRRIEFTFPQLTAEVAAVINRAANR